jgi:hypothetical protein
MPVWVRKKPSCHLSFLSGTVRVKSTLTDLGSLAWAHWSDISEIPIALGTQLHPALRVLSRAASVKCRSGATCTVSFGTPFKNSEWWFGDVAQQQRTCLALDWIPSTFRKKIRTRLLKNILEASSHGSAWRRTAVTSRACCCFAPWGFGRGSQRGS